ncbi:MAG: tripartite tricarboxylate transporter substrate binding protein [Burkholderiales bacterium]
MKTTSILLCGVALSAIGIHAVAQNFPTKPVRIVVPFPPGGTSDATARLIAQRLTERWKQNVVVDNRGGAGGNIAAEHVARSPADGYTLLMGTHGTQAINISLFAKLPYDPVRDFAPVTLAITVPNLFLAHPSLPVRSMKDLVALAKARPGEINFASAGYGTMPHMAGELFNLMAGVKMTPILYKGSGPAMSEVLGGLVPLMIESLLTSLPHVKSGKLRALAITSAQRNPAVMDISTVAETGFAGYEGITWVGLVVPAATPRDVVSLLNTEIARILQAPEMKERLAAMGATPGGGSPEQFAGYIRSETEKWAKVVKAAGLKAE